MSLKNRQTDSGQIILCVILDSRAVFIRGLSPEQGRVKVPGEKEGGGGYERVEGEEMEEKEGGRGG